MTRTELFNVAQKTGETLAGEHDGAKIDAAISEAKTTLAIDGADYAIFKGDVLEAKHRFAVLGNQKLPSEIKAIAAAAKKPE